MNMNTTVNGSSCSSPLNPKAEKIGKTIAFSLILFVSLVGNSLIAIIVYKTQTLRKPINFFIVNMAMSDLLFAIFFFPLELTFRYVDSWFTCGRLGQALCMLRFFLPSVSSTASVQSLVLIAVDRFAAVVFPLRYPLISSKLCPFFIFATWIVAFGLLWPLLFAQKLVDYKGQLLCLRQWDEALPDSSSDRTFFTAIPIVFFYVPFTFLIILYSIILTKLKSQTIPGEQSRNVLKMAIAILLGFVLCWFPLSTIEFLRYFLPDRRLPCTIFIIYHFIAPLMAYVSCAINPCICFIFSANYRQGLKRLLMCVRGSQE